MHICTFVCGKWIQISPHLWKLSKWTTFTFLYWCSAATKRQGMPFHRHRGVHSETSHTACKFFWALFWVVFTSDGWTFPVSYGWHVWLLLRRVNCQTASRFKLTNDPDVLYYHMNIYHLQHIILTLECSIFTCSVLTWKHHCFAVELLRMSHIMLLILHVL